MIFEDIIALAKAGYTPADVKELMALNKEEKDIPEEKENLQESEDKIQKPEENLQEVEDKKEDIDYKALYEAEQQKVADLQQKNIKRDIKGLSDGKTDDEIVSDFMRSFM